MSRPSKYPEQFRKDAVELVRSSDRPSREVARQLGVNHETLRSWARAADGAETSEADELASGEREELRTLGRKTPAESLNEPLLSPQ
ncbi:transposase [Saccharopolyspora soli]|uniref:transposase n=1 Tax=Saccharopolyspora soli TaxID=2926618 RepID=UPI001F593A7C|nr:transposase [Saccharopolyspora soli]